MCGRSRRGWPRSGTRCTSRLARRRGHSLRVPCAGSPMAPPLGRKELRWARRRAVTRLARDIRADAVIERYYNFGGEGILAGAALGAGRCSRSTRRSSTIRVRRSISSTARWSYNPMRRWRERICRTADVIVTPSAAILPPDTPSAKIVVLEWGADTDRFRPRRRAAAVHAAVRDGGGVRGRVQPLAWRVESCRAIRQLNERRVTAFRRS